MYNSLTVNEEGWSQGARVVGVIGVHLLSVVDARGVVTGVGVGVFVFKGFGLALAASTGSSLDRGRSGERGVIGVEVPGRRGKLVPGW